MGYQKINENSVVLLKEEYDCLKRIEKAYDPFWFCAFGGCEGACKECKDTCEMSIFVKEHKETAEKILKEVYFYASSKETINLLTRIKEIATREGVEIKE